MCLGRARARLGGGAKRVKGSPEKRRERIVRACHRQARRTSWRCAQRFQPALPRRANFCRASLRAFRGRLSGQAGARGLAILLSEYGNILAGGGVNEQLLVLLRLPENVRSVSVDGMIALEAKGLMKCYTSVPAVSRVSFSLKSGDVLGCLGPTVPGRARRCACSHGAFGSHARAGTLFAGKYPARFGQLSKTHGLRSGRGQSLSLSLSGWEYLELVGTLRGMDHAILAKKIDALLELFSLHGHRHSAMGHIQRGYPDTYC